MPKGKEKTREWVLVEAMGGETSLERSGDLSTHTVGILGDLSSCYAHDIMNVDMGVVLR